MHIPHRDISIAVLAVAILSLASGTVGQVPLQALVTPRHDLQEELNAAIESAAGAYKHRPRTYAPAQKTSIAMTDEVLREKEELEQQIDDAKQYIEKLREEHGIDPADKEARTKLIEKQRDAFLTFLRTHRARSVFSTSQTDSDLLRRVLFGAVSDSEAALRMRALTKAGMQSLVSVMDSEGNIQRLAALEKRHQELGNQYARSAAPAEPVEVGGATRDQINRIVAEVHSQVLRLQSELARIDARLRRRSERALIEKGLLDPRPGEHAEAVIPFTPSFVWPAYGRISAAYLSPGYVRIFGVPHKAIDIVIPQGSPVVAAADGVVFLVRDGGQTGYSYILIGHRGGYATLYGHLSGFGASAGQDVTAGQYIGSSGGAKGGYGSGPMTTGPHLHFEVIQSGVNINPQAVLP